MKNEKKKTSNPATSIIFLLVWAKCHLNRLMPQLPKIPLNNSWYVIIGLLWDNILLGQNCYRLPSI